ncbi:hypothetical protein [Massilia sp. MS-15]|uniref:hypothetical protein n=1 Tax=Massilia sp. MS-15 TaxID=2878200 RepID=UPI001CD4218B|nr:hypothetical protein [Massilia sp. MS-15]MCA1248851.1 hypothetical protein [Massilia sp. MS-15]
MKKIVLAIAAAAFATVAYATPPKPKCTGICPPDTEEGTEADGMFATELDWALEADSDAGQKDKKEKKEKKQK